MIRCGQLAQPARPRRRLFVAVRSAARTAQIGRAAVIFQKNPSAFRKSTCDPEFLSGYFARNSDFFEINPQSRTDALRVFLQKNPYLFRKSTRAPQTLSPIFAKTSSDFSQINIQSNFDYIFFSKKKNVWPVHRAHGRARKTSLLINHMQCLSYKTWFYFTPVVYSLGDQLTGIHAGWYYNVLANIRCSPKEGNYRGVLQLQEPGTKSLG